jgi:hypothetical protein
MQNTDKKHGLSIFRFVCSAKDGTLHGLGFNPSSQHDVDPKAIATGRGELRLCPLKRFCGVVGSFALSEDLFALLETLFALSEDLFALLGTLFALSTGFICSLRDFIRSFRRTLDCLHRVVEIHVSHSRGFSSSTGR